MRAPRERARRRRRGRPGRGTARCRDSAHAAPRRRSAAAQRGGDRLVRGERLRSGSAASASAIAATSPRRRPAPAPPRRESARRRRRAPAGRAGRGRSRSALCGTSAAVSTSTRPGQRARSAARSPSSNAACACGERITRIASTGRRRPGQRVGAEALGAADLGRRVEPRGAAADGAARRAAPAASTDLAGARRPAPPRRSCGSRCSGTARRRAHRAPRLRSAAAFVRSSASALISIPGVQMPHCAAPWATKARCSGDERAVGAARPSTVSTSRPAHWPTATMHAQTCSPSSSTVQAPQSPAWQPILVPVRPSSSRSASDRRRAGSPASSRGAPLTPTRTMWTPAGRARSCRGKAARARRSRVMRRVEAVGGAGAQSSIGVSGARSARLDQRGEVAPTRRADEARLERRQAPRHRRAAADRDAGVGDRAGRRRDRATTATIVIEITR